MRIINAKGLYYRELNSLVRDAINKGEKEILLKNVNGQYYIGAGLQGEVKIAIEGVPGNDLGVFMDGPTIILASNGQDNIGNTMNSGKIVVQGSAGDVLGYGMRGGKLFVKGDVGYRVGIHMKGYRKQIPVIIVGGSAGDFFGEYMAGGILMLLGLGKEAHNSIVGNHLATGMHGGVIYIRGEVDRKKLGRGIDVRTLDDTDKKLLAELLKEYSNDLGLDYENIISKPFSKLIPQSSRPYGAIYAY